MDYNLSKKIFSAATPRRRQPQSAKVVHDGTPYTPRLAPMPQSPLGGSARTTSTPLSAISLLSTSASKNIRVKTPIHDVMAAPLPVATVAPTTRNTIRNPRKKKKAIVGASSPTPAVAKRFTPKHFSEEEVKELLHGYSEVPKDCWEDLKRSDHIRWYTSDGQLRRGAYVRRVYDRGAKKYIDVETIIGTIPGIRGGFIYTLCFDNVSKIFRRVQGSIPLELSLYHHNIDAKLEDVVSQLTSTIEGLTVQIKLLENRIAELENINNNTKSIVRK